MFHYRAWARAGSVLFRDDVEAGHLWELVGRAWDGLRALCVMPDHVHVMARDADGIERLARAKSGYSRWRGQRRGEGAPAWSGPSAVDAVPDPAHGRRLARYIELNPTRAGIVRDPLAWAWSTHRDRCGLVADPVVEAARDPTGWHHYVSSDPTVEVGGTPMPEIAAKVPDLAEVHHAVAAAYRTVPEGRIGRCERRSALMRTAAALEVLPPPELAAALGVHRTTLARATAGLLPRVVPRSDRVLAACMATCGDRRFRAPTDRDLRATPGWERYRGRS